MNNARSPRRKTITVALLAVFGLWCGLYIYMHSGVRQKPAANRDIETMNRLDPVRQSLDRGFPGVSWPAQDLQDYAAALSFLTQFRLDLATQCLNRDAHFLAAFDAVKVPASLTVQRLGLLSALLLACDNSHAALACGEQACTLARRLPECPPILRVKSLNNLAVIQFVQAEEISDPALRVKLLSTAAVSLSSASQALSQMPQAKERGLLESVTSNNIRAVASQIRLAD